MAEQFPETTLTPNLAWKSCVKAALRCNQNMFLSVLFKCFRVPVPVVWRPFT